MNEIHVEVRRMLDLIHDRYSERLTLDALERAFGQPSAYLSRLFRHETGISIHDHVTRTRLANAATLIRAGVKIEAVALSVGYQSKKNFYRQFKRQFGSTPEQYRRVERQGVTSTVTSSAVVSPPSWARHRST